MHLPEVEPAWLRLTAEFWEASAVLAGLRTASNEAHRARDRDRGAEKNRLNDIQGAAGELIALRRLEVLTGTQNLRSRLFDPAGPVDDLDLSATLDGEDLRIEAKCHLHEERKRLFLVNERAHQRSRRRGAAGYVPIFSALGCGRAIVGSLVPIEALDGWQRKTWASRPERDVALGCDLSSFSCQYFGSAYSHLVAQLASSVTAETRLAEVYDQAMSGFASGRVELDLDGATAFEVRDRLLRHGRT